MIDDVVINKIEAIKRCLSRIQSVYANQEAHLKDCTKQDSIVLNIQRACESSIDLAMHIIAIKKLGVPQSSRDAFDILNTNHIICEDLSVRMKKMVGFRNIAVHDYQKLQTAIIKAIIENHLTDFEKFANEMRPFSEREKDPWGSQ